MEDLSVGEMAGRLGVAPSTVRMWGRRYGLNASARSDGGHRRYTPDDVARLQRMQHLVNGGVDPAEAAARAHAGDDASVGPGGREGAGDSARHGGPGGSVLAVPGADPSVRGLARAASRLQEGEVTSLVGASLRHRGAIATWTQLLVPVLTSAGEHWERSGSGIEVEHLLTQAVSAAFTAYTLNLPEVAQDRSVIVAGGPNEDHVLALHAVRSALVERGVPVRFLGPRTPLVTLAATARLTRAPALLLWSSLTDPAAAVGLADVRAAHRRVLVLVGGPGWNGLDTSPATVCTSLEDAVDQLATAWQGRRGALSKVEG